MSRHDFEKSVRMFRKFSEETLKRRGGGPMSREGVVALQAIEAVLRGERKLTGSLLEPLAALTSLLQSGQLPPEFGHFNLADAILAVEEASAQANETAEQRWEFTPELSDPVAARLVALGCWEHHDRGAADNAEAGGKTHAGGLRAHLEESRRLILEAASRATSGNAVVVGAGRAHGVPLAELAQRFQRVTLNDVRTATLEETVRAEVPEALRERISIERYDLTGSYEQFVKEVEERIGASTSPPDAEHALVELAESYDVGAGSAGISGPEGTASFAVSSMVLSELGAGFPLHVARCFSERGWELASPPSAALNDALALLTCIVQQHHVYALLRRAELAVLITGVSEAPLRVLSDGRLEASGDPRELLAVERLSERLPQGTEILAEADWEWRRGGDTNGSATAQAMLLVEGVVMRKASRPRPS